MEPKSEQQYRDEYRSQLLEYAKQSQNSYDTTLITLSGGALGISFAFVNQFIGDDPMVSFPLLVIAWTCWIISLVAVLFSFATSNHALRKVVESMDRGQPLSEKPGGKLDRLTSWLNAISGILFAIGVVAMMWFAISNM